jgi:hypothetical protein
MSHTVTAHWDSFLSQIARNFAEIGYDREKVIHEIIYRRYRK